MIFISAIWLCLTLVLFLLVVYKKWSLGKRSAEELKNEFDMLAHLTVIVPFRNEEKRIGKLLDSLANQKALPNQIIFVDDHSEDNSVDVIQSFCQNRFAFDILALPDNQKGKKMAIQLGVKFTKTPYVLTLDADVYFDAHYFSSINDLNPIDLHVLPVIPTSQNKLGELFVFEYLLLNALNYVLAPFYVLSASGANLLFSKATYYGGYNGNQDKEPLSGDDYFLLRSFQKIGAKIKVHNDYRSAVYTDESVSWKAYLMQRSRWASKVKPFHFWQEALVGIAISGYFFSGFLLIIYLISQNHWVELFVYLGTFTFVSLLVLQSYKVIHRLKWIIAILFPVIYPVLMVLVFLSSYFVNKTWKQRSLKIR